MNGPEHYDEAERLLGLNSTTKAMVHATLAQVAATIDAAAATNAAMWPGPSTTPTTPTADPLAAWKAAVK